MLLMGKLMNFRLGRFQNYQRVTYIQQITTALKHRNDDSWIHVGCHCFCFASPLNKYMYLVCNRNLPYHTCIYIYVHIYIYIHMCVCVCVSSLCVFISVFVSTWNSWLKTGLEIGIWYHVWVRNGQSNGSRIPTWVVWLLLQWFNEEDPLDGMF